MSPYQHLFSTNAVLNVWRNLRNTRDHNDLLLSFHVHPDDVRNARDRRFGKGGVVETTNDAPGRKSTSVEGRGAIDGRSIGFIVPWRSMQAQKKELREREKELADALVVLAGEVSFMGRSSSLPAPWSHVMSRLARASFYSLLDLEESCDS